LNPGCQAVKEVRREEATPGFPEGNFQNKIETMNLLLNLIKLGVVGPCELLFVAIALVPLAIIGLAVYKVIKSKLPDWEMVYWIVAFIILNILAAIPFIIFHDYFLAKEKRAGYKVEV
jgi:undecaprenyl pyrophosphate phosphatase UppP